jgi:DNA polymerase-3 subunit delta
MILYLYGEDTFRSRQYLTGAIVQFKKTRDPQGYNVVRLDGKKEEGGKIISELLSAPFLAEKRLVVVEDLLSKKDDEFFKAVTERLQEKKFPDSTVAIFWQGEPIGKSKAAKALEAQLLKEQYATAFPPLVGKEKNDWIIKEVAARGGKTDTHTVQYLSENTSDMWELNSVLNQLVVHANGSDITPQMAAQFVPVKLDDNIFSLVDAIAAGRTKQALELLEHQRRLGEEDGKIFGLIVWQFRILLQMADALERDESLTSDGLASKLKLHPFVVKKNLGLVRSTSLSRLSSMYRKLLDIDTQTKTGVAPQSVLIDFFVAAQ